MTVLHLRTYEFKKISQKNYRIFEVFGNLRGREIYLPLTPAIPREPIFVSSVFYVIRIAVFHQYSGGVE